MKKQFLRALLPVLATMAAFASAANAATIIGTGSETLGGSWDTNGIQWVTNGYGTAGYYLAKTVYGSGDYEDYSGGYSPSVMTLSAPSWASLSASDAAVNGQVNYGYRSYQQPDGTGKQSVGYMGRLWSGGMTVGQEYSLYDFTITSAAPTTFEFTVTYHTEAYAIPSSFKLQQTAGTGTGNNASLAAIAIPDAYSAGFTTFTVENAQVGDVFQILGTSTNASNMLINGVMIQAVPEPSTVALLALAGAALVVLRKRRMA